LFEARKKSRSQANQSGPPLNQPRTKTQNSEVETTVIVAICMERHLVPTIVLGLVEAAVGALAENAKP
jgi:hypothetical protein